MSLIVPVVLFSGLALLFAMLLRGSGVIADAHGVVAAAEQSLQVMRDSSLSDRQKESATQAASRQLFGKFLLITIKCLAALAAPAAILFGLVLLGFFSTDSLQQAAADWLVITVSSIVAVVAMLIPR